MKARCLRALLVALLLILNGCRNSNSDLLEMELRAKDVQFREALEELGKSEMRNDALLREMEALRKGANVSPELAAQSFTVRKLVLGRGTGGVDDDGLPGDEAIRIQLEPRDIDDHVIKAPGTLHVLALEVNFQGLKVPLCSWTVEPDKLRASWKQGLLSSGYQVVLPWKNSPRTENVRVVVRLVLTDGRVYETDKDIRVRVIPGATGAPESKAPAIEFAPPPQLLDPATVPASHKAHAAPRATTPASAWQPTPLDAAIRLGRPEPITAPPPRRLLGSDR